MSYTQARYEFTSSVAATANEDRVGVIRFTEDVDDTATVTYMENTANKNIVTRSAYTLKMSLFQTRKIIESTVLNKVLICE